MEVMVMTAQYKAAAYCAPGLTQLTPSPDEAFTSAKQYGPDSPSHVSSFETAKAACSPHTHANQCAKTSSPMMHLPSESAE